MKISFIIFLSVSVVGFSQTKLDLRKESDALSMKFQKEKTDLIQRKLNLDEEIKEFSIKYQKERSAFFDVLQIQNIDAEIVYRFWNTSNVLEIRSKNGKVTAKIIYAVQNVEKDFQFFRKTFSLSNKDAESVYNLFSNKYGSLKELNRENGFDRVSYLYEGKSWNNYSLYSYHTCCNDLKEAKVYLEINKELKSLINYENYFSIFDKEIPFRSCTYYGVAYTILKFQH